MEILDRAIGLLNEERFSDVIDLIDDFLNRNPEFRKIDYHHFVNPIEELLFNVYIGDVKKAKTLDLDMELEELYVVYSIAYGILGDIESAEKYLNVAHMINPVSAPILMRLCEFYQAKHEEERLKGLAEDILRYTYDPDLLKSCYFKLADYYYHVGDDLEMYGHLLNFFAALKGVEDMDVGQDISYLEGRGVQVGFNGEVVDIIIYLIDIHQKQGMPHTAEYFHAIMGRIVEFSMFLNDLKGNMIDE